MKEEEGRGAAEKVREGGRQQRDGVLGKLSASVNDATLSARRLQLCLSEQQCRHVEHGSRLAGAWQGPVLLCCFLQLVVLLMSAEGERRESSEI